jgi:hypothetical protein
MVMSAGFSTVGWAAGDDVDELPGAIRVDAQDRVEQDIGPDDRRRGRRVVKPSRALAAIQPEQIHSADRLRRRDRAGHAADEVQPVRGEADLVSDHIQARVLRTGVGGE